MPKSIFKRWHAKIERLLESGTVHLVGTDYDKIMNEVSTLLDDAEAYAKMSQAVNPYGDGMACPRIADALK